GVSYAITVGNGGGVATSGQVTVTDVLPAGLTYAGAASVNGWIITTNGQTVTAQRTDSLASLAAYPVLTLTVNLANTAPSSVTNTATVAGGGEVNLANDTATDVTPILPIADLTISMTRSGEFSKGRFGFFNILVSHAGGAATTAPVVVTTTLPVGLEYRPDPKIPNTGW